MGATGTADEERRRRRAVTLTAAVGPADDDGPAGGATVPDRRGRLARVCGVSMSEVGVSGAGITVMSSVDAGRAGHRDQVWASGPLTRRLEDLQLTTGEGPCLDAYESGAPVLAGRLAAEASRWPGFGPEAVAAGAAAVFSLPLQVGVVRLGTLDLHRGTEGALGTDQLADALVLARLATETLLELVGDRAPPAAAGPGDDGADRSTGWLPDAHAEVHQASGMVSVQESISVGEALLRIRAFAFARGVPIGEVARHIVARELVLREDDDPAG